MTREELIEAIRAQAPLFRERRVKHVSLFGSRARGDHRPDSDVDLLVEYEPEIRVTAWSWAGLTADLSERLGREVQVVRAPIADARMRSAVDRDAIHVL